MPDEVCRPFGFGANDVVITPLGIEVTIIGVKVPPAPAPPEGADSEPPADGYYRICLPQAQMVAIECGVSHCPWDGATQNDLVWDPRDAEPPPDGENPEEQPRRQGTMWALFPGGYQVRE